MLLVSGVLRRISISSRNVQHAVRDEILSRPVGVHNRRNQILRNILIIGQELLRVLREAIAAVSEGRIVVVRPDPGIQADTVNDLSGIQPLRLRIGIQLVKIRYPQCQIGVGKKLHRLRLGQSHKERINVLLDRSLLQKCPEHVRRFHILRVSGIRSDNDAGRVKIVIQGLGLS